ncbi:hypothetical protein C1702_03280 [Caldimonas thermodepolymerans]|jgi:quercetin dioxygenase-like cupin family protein|uniref:Cupin superfamily protein n=2 Tax=Caldimonas thermodepolymerans TaxID=215580 RepID=A0A2S5T7N1_9BURK|nr:hypothetical protein C1702_03280 [Caldimonas thermodepolymerans]RDH99736.1 putative cupin superfamily protein [Caldimonas thermodepolymerans]TCP07538.1 putative cupin superfamily protein [Caldimonas thermodepolymerans]
MIPDMTSLCNAKPFPEPFPVAGTLLHAGDAGDVTRLPPPVTPAVLEHLDGRVLGAYVVSTPDDAHSHLWEMHPAADEVLYLLAGELEVEHDDGQARGRTRLRAHEGLVMPRGVWHRLVVRQPGMLLALTTPRGTQLRPHAADAHAA